MKPLTLRTGLFLAIDVALLVLCLANIPSVLNRARAPFEIRGKDTAIVVTRILSPDATDGLSVGDELITWNHHRVTMEELVDFLGDLSRIGDRIQIGFVRDGIASVAQITLVSYYASPRFIIISTIVGLLVWAIAVLVLLSRSADLPSTVLHWGLITFSVTVMLTLGAIERDSIYSLFARTIWLASYTLVGPFFFYFTTLYPKRGSGLIKLKPFVLFGLAGILILGQTYYHLASIMLSSTAAYEIFQQWFDGFSAALLVFVFGGILNLIHSYRNAESKEDRRRMEWVLWGICIGAAPFLLLIKLPQFVLPGGLVGEEYATIFFLVIPFAFAISIIKYQFLDIQVVINRSIVYAALTLFLALVCFLAVLLFPPFIGGTVTFQEYLFIASVAMLAGLLFQPLRSWTQRIVDENLFASRTHFRKAVKDFGKEVQESLSSDEVYQRLTSMVARFVPSRLTAAYRFEEGELVLIHAQGAPLHQRHHVGSQVLLSLQRGNVCALQRATKMKGDEIDFSVSGWLEGFGASLCVPLLTDSKELIGAMAVEPRSAYDQFEEEEIDLLVTACALAEEVLQRLVLAEKVIVEREAKRRSEELSELKSYFISSVSHELRMPLTSIRMFAETLRSGKIKSVRKRNEYLGIIHGESERLSRLIGNILDFAKIERGEKTYHFAATDLKDVSLRAANAMRYQFEKSGARLTVRISKRLPKISADSDALEEAILNLLSNALKYSTRKKKVNLKVFKASRYLAIEVADEGIGIAPSELPHIFDRFYRVADFRTRQVGGAGLGLALVEHIVKAHKGKIAVASIPGKGSRFTIQLPISQTGRKGKE